MTISDNGFGIPHDIVHSVFDPFFSTKQADKQRGSGLGLSIVDAVIKDHDGYIDLESTVGEGTTFYIYVPISREAIEERQLEETVGGTEKILIVDDDAMLREVTTKLLAGLNYDATAVDSGEKALAFIKEYSPDLLVLDMIMPGGIDGTDTFMKALELNPQLKVIIVSGYAHSERVQAAREMGATTFVQKPFTRVRLARAVRNALDTNPVSVVKT